MKWAGNEIGDSGAGNISESLRMNTRLTILDLGVIEKKEE